MCTHCNQGTGYARVANKITNYLADIAGVEVIYYGFQNYPGQDIKDRFIDPRIRFYDAIVEDPDAPKGFGDKGIVPAIRREKPDALFIYNDMSVINAIINLIPESIMPPKKYIYVDIVYPWESLHSVEGIRNTNFDMIFTFADFWTKHLVDDLNFEKEKVVTMHHGIDFERLKAAAPKKESKAQLGFAEDDFLVINMNRNSPRKQWATTIRAFMDFLKNNNMDKHIKLFCGCMMVTKDGYDIRKLIRTESRILGLDADEVLSHFFFNAKPLHLTDAEVSGIYSAGDVGMNTACGEGFGLTTLEHSYFNAPQIVTGLPILKEVLGKNSYFIEPKIATISPNHEHEQSGLVYFCDHKDFSTKLQECYDNRMVQRTAESRERIEQMFDWNKVLVTLDSVFK